jgi:hypothetical protein
MLINSSIAYVGADGIAHHMSDDSIAITFWTASVIMFVAFFLAFFYSRSASIRVISGPTSQTAQSVPRD